MPIFHCDLVIRLRGVDFLRIIKQTNMTLGNNLVIVIVYNIFDKFRRY